MDDVNGSQKKCYQQPLLTVVGNVREITLKVGTTSKNADKVGSGGNDKTR